ncbi:MAG: hypothetical protein ACI9XR_002299 [Flavobacterium sp.]|jgi:hypothetical protein
MKKTTQFTLTLFLSSFLLFSQQDSLSNIQNYTPSKLLEKGKVDIKWFNNLYTQTRENSNGENKDVARSNFFTTSLEVFTGISENKKINLGLIVEYRSNSFAGENTTSVFEFENKVGKSRIGLSHIAPSLKIAPFSSLPRFSVQSSLFIPVFKDEVNSNGFLAQKSFIWQNRFFYDYTFPGSKFQLFTEFGTRLFLGNKDEGFANNSIELAPGVFLSYFPSSKFTILGFLQHAQLVDLGNDFAQNYTAIGTGSKYQLTPILNLELLYSKFVRAQDGGIGQSFNLGLRAIF